MDDDNKEIIKEIIDIKINSKLLKNVLSLYKDLKIDQLKLVFFQDRMEIKITDPAHVEMIYSTIENALCEEYHFDLEIKNEKLDENSKIEIGIDLEKIFNALKNCKKDDLFIFHYNGIVEPDYFTITTNNFIQKIGKCTLDNFPDFKIPELNFRANFNISTDQLHEFLKRSENISDYLTIKTTSNNVLLHSEGDTDKIDLNADVNSLRSYSEHKSNYSIDYMITAITGLKRLFKDIEIKLASDYPISLTGDLQFLKVLILIAPRIERD